MNVLYDSLPEALEVDGRLFPIYTDFRDWLAFGDMIEDQSVADTEKAFGALQWYKEEIPQNGIAAGEALAGFYAQNGAPRVGSPTATAPKNDRPVLSWKHDAWFVIGAFLQAYGMYLPDLPYLHWWAFRGLFDALPEACPIVTRMSYRAVDLSSIKDKHERKRILTVQRAVALPSGALRDEDIGAAFTGVF